MRKWAWLAGAVLPNRRREVKLLDSRSEGNGPRAATSAAISRPEECRVLGPAGRGCGGVGARAAEGAGRYSAAAEAGVIGFAASFFELLT